MATITASDIIQQLRLRVRGTASSDGFILGLVSKVQQVANGALRLVIGTATLNTYPYQQIYDLRADAPRQLYVLGLRTDGVYDADKMYDWRELYYVNRHWARMTPGSQVSSFAMLGRDVLITYPPQPTTGSPELVYIKLTENLETEDQALEIPRERAMVVTDIAEILLLLRERRLESIKPLMERLAREIGVDIRLPEVGA